MTITKGKNSILVLTTLGVYLSLLMVGGAAPQVFAHSATTRNFDISDEVEVKDEIDDLPASSFDEWDVPLGQYLNDLEKIIDNLRLVKSIERFDLEKDSFSIGGTAECPCDFVDIRPLMISEKGGGPNQWLAPVFTEARLASERWLDYSTCFEGAIPAKNSGKRSASIFLEYNGAELKYSVTFRKNSATLAEEVTKGIVTALESFRIKKEFIALTAKIEVTSTGTHVFIVTRLPRADLDALLAKDAK